MINIFSRIFETEEEIKKRLEKWDNYLVTDGDKGTEKSGNKTISTIAKDSNVVEKSKTTEYDSDQETRSSAGSDDETDEETTSGQEMNSDKVNK